MGKLMKTQWGFILLALASAYSLFVYILPVFSSATRDASVAGACVHRQHRLVAKGTSPGSKQWSVIATIRNNGGCNTWLLGMNFDPSDGLRGSWSGAWSIPARGHLFDGATIGAQDEAAGSERVFSGVTGVHVRTVVLSMSDGERITVHPKLVSARSRKQFVWLQDMRYFVYYYPAGQHVKVARLLNSRDEVIFTAQGEEGLFEGPMSEI